MNCNDYLAMLSTLPVEELEYGSARAHATECRDCDRVTRVVVERERSMIVAYADLGSTEAASQVAANAFALSNRRRVAFYYKILLSLAALATVLFMLSRTVREPAARAVIAGTPISNAGAEMLTETLVVRCGSPDEAAEMLRTHLQGDARVTFRSFSSPGFITIEATRQQMDVARDVLARLDRSNGACAVLAPEPAPPIPPAKLAPLAPIAR